MGSTLKSMRLLAIVIMLSLWAQSPASDRILLFRPNNPYFASAENAIREGLEPEHEIKLALVDAKTSYDEFDRHIKTQQPKALILMDNVSIDFYKHYQTVHKGEAFPPAIASMALFIGQVIDGMDQTVGIDYQVPAVTSLSNLRELIGKPVKKVGVIYRKQHNDFFARQQKLCSREQITLIGYPIDEALLSQSSRRRDKKMRGLLKQGLITLIDKEKIDALWILNDNLLLSDREGNVRGVWSQELESFKKPIIVGARNLFTQKLGNFAMLPDHSGIGEQIATLMWEIIENGWKVPQGPQVKDPYAKTTVINLEFAREYLKFKESKRDEVTSEEEFGK